MEKYILSFDAGTTSSRAIVFDSKQHIVSIAQKEFTQYYPHPSWVEHDAKEIWTTQLTVAREALEKAGISGADVNAIGITNQRETTVVWDKDTGLPVCNAIAWQCRRTADICDEIVSQGWGDAIRKKTGLIPDAYFSATKIKWILDRFDPDRSRSRNGELLFGTIDTWLLWNLTGGAVHATDPSNACRTMLYNIHEMDWDDELLDLFGVPRKMLPEVRNSSGDFGNTSPSLFEVPIPITGIAGDQQAALFGQTAFYEGDVKNTYGTGCFILMNTGERPVASRNGLLTTVGWRIGDKVTYVLEGSVFIGGAVIQWLRDELCIISSAADSELEAQKVPDTAGVYFVPAFTGLGAPHWEPDVRGTIVGLTRGANRNHIVRAALEAIAFQSKDVIEAMKQDVGVLTSLDVDGGASANNFLMQFQADILGIPVCRPSCTESTALGAASLAGLYTGFYKSMDDLKAGRENDRVFMPSMDEKMRSELTEGWQKAINAAKSL